MLGEAGKVGFANYWLRAPVEVYGVVPFESSDGLDVSYRSHFGRVSSTSRVYAGTQSLRDDVTKGQAQVWGITHVSVIGNLKLRAAYTHVHFQTAGEGFGPLLLTVASTASALPDGIGQNAAANALRMRDSYDTSLGGQAVQLFDVGAMYDGDHWFAHAEIIKVKIEGLLPSSTGGFISAGYHAGSFTPYATYSRSETDKQHEAGIPLTGLTCNPAASQFQHCGVVIPAQLANAIVLGIHNADSSQQTIAAGLRWDVTSSVC